MPEEPSMSRAIQLTPHITRHVDSSVDGIRLTLTVTAAVDMPTEVFAYLTKPPVPGSEDMVAEFSHVCSPVDLAEFPIAEPTPEAIPPWFRTDSVDLVFRSRAEALEAYNDISTEVSVLRDALDRMDVLSALPAVWYGTPPT
jgi:hypothetical protein